MSVSDDALATLLIAGSEYSREEAHHSVFVETEERARHLVQLLLEISAERLLRRALVEGGMTNWTGDNIDAISERLERDLNALIGAFHGPEVHLSGTAPMQVHYNAGIVTSSLSIINTHIYFNESSAPKGKRK